MCYINLCCPMVSVVHTYELELVLLLSKFSGNVCYMCCAVVSWCGLCFFVVMLPSSHPTPCSYCFAFVLEKWYLL